MNPIDELAGINQSLHQLLGTPEPAELTPLHESDDLMVWFLLGGKDVGKSTFLNAMLDMEVSKDRFEQGEGTWRFVAHVHESARERLARRLAGLPIEMQIHTHTSDAHQRLCLIDSPDFDSRFERHVHQVREVLQAGVADGAVLLASAAKYKDRQYWGAFDRLAGVLSPRHILFALTKADELGQYMDEVRDDFVRTIVKRVGHWEGNGTGAQTILSRTYLINSLDRALDFPRLESGLMRRLSADEVRDAHDENLRHALVRGNEQLQAFYHLDEIADALESTLSATRVADVFAEHFPEAYFDTVRTRLAEHKALVAPVREKLWNESGHTLAGVAAIMAMVRWFGSWSPAKWRTAASEAAEFDEVPMHRALRWGQEDLSERLTDAQRTLLAEVHLPHAAPAMPSPADTKTMAADLRQLFDDHLARAEIRPLPRVLQVLINAPVYMYLAFFVTLLSYPALLLLQAWGVLDAPRVAGLLTLDNVKVSVIGFAGYYIMAALFIVRKQREWIKRECVALADRFVLDTRELLREAVARPLSRFAAEFNKLRGRLVRVAGQQKSLVEK